MKQLADRRQRQVRRVGFWIAVTAIGAYLLFVGDQRPHHLLLLWLEDNRTEERIDALEAERRELRAEARHLATDTLALEALARQKGMIRPGDLVYRIVPVPPDVHQAAAESLAARAARIAADSLAAAREAEAAAREAAAARKAERERARAHDATPYPRPAPREDDAATDRDPAVPSSDPESEGSAPGPEPPEPSSDPGPSDATSEVGTGALRAASPRPRETGSAAR